MRKLTQQHIDAYKNGKLKKLFEAIKEDPELSFEIRMRDEAMVYYHKDKILTTHIQRGGNLKFTTLSEKYCKGTQKSPSWYFDNSHQDHTLKCKTDMRKYFKEAKHLVYAYKMGQEFEIQQNIALGNHSFINRFVVVDMEWQYSQSQLKKEDRVVPKTRIDLIIVDTMPNKNNQHDVYLAELKVGLDATEGKSGTIDHVQKTYKIITNKLASKDLLNDVSNFLSQKIELGIITDKPKIWEFNPNPELKMMIILAYRGQQEYIKLKEDAEVAKEEAAKLGMTSPRIYLYDAFIPFNRMTETV